MPEALLTRREQLGQSAEVAMGDFAERIAPP
jgi:hypothetical protein